MREFFRVIIFLFLITELGAQEELILELLDNIPSEEERKKYFREILEDKNSDNSTNSSKRSFDFEPISMKSIFSKKANSNSSKSQK